MITNNATIVKNTGIIKNAGRNRLTTVKNKPPQNHIFPARRWVLLQFSSSFNVQGKR
jgi:hypothetical protein